MRIERKTIIKALRTEKLKQGSFCYDDEKGCPVCAVGAVFRSLGVADNYINRLADAEVQDCPITSERGIELGLRKKNYMAALSCKFESLVGYGNRVTKEHRETMVKFVKKNFPKLVTLKEVRKVDIVATSKKVQNA